ncbi:DNA methyltransferase [bacterium]|nr:DNA methyltransferase [bacterium]
MAKEDPTKILESAYRSAVEEIKKDSGESFLNTFDNRQRNWLITITEKSELFKGVIAALTTSLAKKIEDPTQDIRYHKEELKGGYSGRTFDTKYVTPFFKKKFRRLAMKESGWLTRSIEQPHAFTLDFPGKIRDKAVKEAFLQILNDIEENKANPQKYLIGLFILLIQQINYSQTKLIYRIPSQRLSIDLIIKCLLLHFFGKYHGSGASKLPVIAIYSIYEILMKDVKRYYGKKLKLMRSHISPDMRAKAIGDVEIVDENNEFFEAVEIKHSIPIDATMIEDAYQKFKDTPIARYYLLTTAEPYIKQGEKQKVNDIIEKIKKEHGCEVIVNGIVPSLKYYLRLLRNPNEFIARYTKNLESEFSKTTEIKRQHIETWRKIVKVKLKT